MRKPKNWYDKQGFPKEFGRQINLDNIEDIKYAHEVLVIEARSFVPKGDVFYIFEDTENKKIAWYYTKGLSEENLGDPNLSILRND